ncbi:MULTISPECIES: FliM/FliN family flagellar motor switch protein [Pseudoalteromonas]|uniref:FliM/FliN family flagellar motor switch protein n=1 Tax=Pseudoalteromonas TaxID=53246 RepID=UPI00083DFCCF|nr:FliM/FliN family flagellar motor C-terminal domain-containing protein [Pseudoalteromonas sp. BMB]ODB37087.1 hypothetical protein BB427_13905 [Pseudoalteromonas sp. BMB]
MENVQPVEFTEITEQSKSGERLLPSIDKKLLKGVQVELECIVGETHIALDKLYSLEVGEVLKLQQTTQDTIKLCLNGNIVAMGRLVAADGKFGVEITDVPVSADE